MKEAGTLKDPDQGLAQGHIQDPETVKAKGALNYHLTRGRKKRKDI